MHACDRPYSIDELFQLWLPLRFSPDTVEAHRRQADETQLFRCSGCDLEIFIPAIVGTPEFYVEAYNLEHTQHDSSFTYVEDKWEFEEALKDAAHCSRVFEIGCGNGNFLSRLIAAGIDAAGSEYSVSAVALARSRALRVLGPEERLQDAGTDWDAVFSFHVLEHTSDPVGFVQRMAAMAAPGGLVGISVPNQDGPIRYVDPCVMNMPPHHVTRWRLSAFRALAARLGLVITRVAYEPLSLENHSYYSVHWVRRVIRGQSLAATSLRFAVSMLLRLFFGGLRRLGLRYFTPLRGQSIYVLMTAA